MQAVFPRISGGLEKSVREQGGTISPFGSSWEITFPEGTQENVTRRLKNPLHGNGICTGRLLPNGDLVCWDELSDRYQCWQVWQLEEV